MHDWIVTDVLALVQSEYLEDGCEDDKVRVRVLRSDAYFFAEKSHSLKCISRNGHHIWSLCRGVSFSQPCEHILREISEFFERREEWQNQVLR